MLIADPQVIDHRSYPGRPTWLKVLTQFIVDSNLRKSWKAAKRLSPDIIIFLGDMMDGGRYRMLDDEYESYYARFNAIFQTRNGTQKYYLVGNHDVGLGSNKAFSAKARQRYLSHFGQTNYQVPVANHSLVFIDAPGLVEEDYVRYEQDEAFEDWTGMPGGTIEYVNRLAQVFSGDDHDYCEVRHPIGDDSGQTVREISVKSFSMAMGIRRPGFQLLSLVAPDPSSPYRQTILVLSYLNAKQPKTKNRPAELGLLKVPQRGPGVPLLRSASLNVPSPRVLRSRPMTPIGSPMIPSSPVLFAATVDDEDEISYPPSPNTAPMTPGSFFDLGEDHAFSLPSPNSLSPIHHYAHGNAAETGPSLFNSNLQRPELTIIVEMVSLQAQTDNMSSPISTSTLSSSSEYSLSTVSTSTSSVDYLGSGFNASRVMYRPMNSADIPRVKDMHHNILKSSSTAAMLRQSLFHLHRRTFVAFIPAKPSPNRTATKPLIIGFATAHIALHGLDIPPEITVVNVAVDTLYRRHGIGENLIRAVTASLLMSATAGAPLKEMRWFLSS
ncbi:hypothetical protein RhiXN_06300 [Rhizoctonia solani]|uniref:Calcineurin-like phosphoesterase domain-containing protein n=1 Tax=Rhizoctonia solani TaxID=456999 RepID=A0A8H8SWS2_9AGAM|nr:uncharacterized protein RhiXN_06300 [Rhizoctonia solani]QRW21311.1 hypothetical protein RhiXN_06300 [Rhizoctonia solani]